MTEAVSTDRAIQIRDLTFCYPGQERAVLDHIDLTVRRGELIVLMGPTGGGKSTLSLCLNGVIPRMLGGSLDGRVEVMGWSPADKDIYEMATQIGLVFQDADSQICNIFVKDEVAFGAQNLLVERQEILERISRVLNFVGLGSFEDRSVFALSGGEKQRVSIASVLAMEPKVVVLDEPTANLDPAGAAEVKALIHDLQENHGVTVIVIEHNITGILDLADRMVVIARGRIAYDGPPRQVLSQFGDAILKDLGLRIPEATEFALAARRKGYLLDPLPLNAAEVQVDPLEFKPAVAFAPPPPEPASDRPPIITVRDVDFRYPNGYQALHQVSVQVRQGEILAILGKNGSGKSTLSSLLIGLNRPTAGQVIVDGLNVSRVSIRELARRVGYVFQYPEHQFVTDTVEAEMAFGLKGFGLPEEEVAGRTEAMLKQFSLEAVRDRHPLSLSRGQKRRLSVASMLVMRPKIFILDEPTTGQDRRNIDQVMKYLLELRQAGLTIILVTHDMELVAAYADRVLVMEQGHVAYEGTPWQLFSQGLAEGDRWGLHLPEIYQIYARARAKAPWLPPPLTPQQLADFLVDRKEA